jgi:3-hydroxybutyryl-CoA dehydratase
MADKEGRLPLEQIVPDKSLASFSRIPTQRRINLYAKMSKDYNPIHVDANYAKQTLFGGTIAHGMLILSYISELMLSAFGSQWLTTGWLSIRFKSPAPSGKKIKVKGRVRSVERIDDKSEIICDVNCLDEAGNPVITGEAGVILNLTNN